jgi:Uma2 family endonuclease
MQQEAWEYRLIGVEPVWIIDPNSQLGCRYAGRRLNEMRIGELLVPGTPVRSVLSEMFAELDRQRPRTAP